MRQAKICFIMARNNFKGGWAKFETNYSIGGSGAVRRISPEFRTKEAAIRFLGTTVHLHQAKKKTWYNQWEDLNILVS